MEMNRWVAAQVKIYEKKIKAFKTCADVLKIILNHARDNICESAIVSTRAKEISSFAGKCVKQYDNLRQPQEVKNSGEAPKNGNKKKRRKSAVEQLTDLCGGRIIVPVQSQVDALAKFVNDNFFVDVGKSQNTAERLKPGEFGYLSVHFIVKINPEAIEKLDLIKKGKITRSQIATVKNLKAEIQIRTIAQHAWADFSHDLIYKSPFTVPRVWQRDSARVAAQVEIIDETIEKIVTGMRTLQTNAGNYMPAKEAKAEIERLKAVIDYSKTNKSEADLSQPHRAARLMMSIGDFEGALEMAARFKDRRDLNLRYIQGDALCRSSVHGSAGYQKGRAILKEVIDESKNTHVEALTRFAQTSPGDDPAKRRDVFEIAYRAAPNDPQVVCGYLFNAVEASSSTGTLSPMQPNIDAAIGICDAQIAARVNLPQALWSKAALHLLCEDPMEALFALSRAICLTKSQSTDDNVRNALLKEHYSNFKKLAAAQPPLVGLNWCLDLFRLVLSKPGSLHDDLLDRKVLLKPADIKPSVAIIAGGCDPHHADRLDSYADLLNLGFKDFSGTIISGGTTDGISGLAGKVMRRGRGRSRIVGVGYLPRKLPGGVVRDSKHYKRLLEMDDAGELDAEHAFTPAQPIQSWIDLLAAGVDPRTVKLIGVDGGLIAGFEYHMAAALGAQVAIVRGSGRQADQLLIEAHEPGNESLMFIPDDPWCVNAFIRIDADMNRDGRFTEQEMDKLADGVHAEYNEICKTQANAELKKKYDNASPETRRAFEDSSRQQALDIDDKLRIVRKEAVPKNVRSRPAVDLTRKEVEELAKYEHGRWVVERLRKHWRLGPSDDKANTRPSLKSWEEIDDQDKEKDIHAIKAIPRLLERIGYKIVAIRKK